MTISYKWLSEYLPETLSPEKLSEILTSVGLEVESMDKVEKIKGGLQGLKIGKVLSCEKHPDADKLKLTTVDVGGDTPLQIVCGAPNVAVNQTVVVAPIGTTIYPIEGEPITMKKAKIRGVESQGMICAEDEIGLGHSHDGIIVINEELQPGANVADYYKIDKPDYVYEIGLTPNRMDSMSHIGVAKDVCAYLSNIQNKIISCKLPETKALQNQANEHFKIEISDTKLCARYIGVCIDNIKVEESPEWLKTKLQSIGLRPINNIVDITNFVLHEWGQPLHAFDRNKINGNKIIIKTANAGDKFLCLDDKERILSNEDLMICDDKNYLCIAGVFGGKNSGVTETTTSVFIESAWFKPTSIRRTSMRHQLRTDAAIRFEKSVDIDNTLPALQRAISLIVEIAGGVISSEIIDVYPQPFQKHIIDLDYRKINKIAGKEFSKEQIKNILKALTFEILSESIDDLKVAVPYAKNDVKLQVDVVEEIMRIDGLDNVPFTGKIAYSLPTNNEPYQESIKNRIAQQLVGKGFYEIFTNSITNSAYYENQEQLVKMINSLSANLDTMRASMLETGLESIAYNFNRKNTEIKFFEFGKVYKIQEKQYIETDMLALYASGHQQTKFWKGNQVPIDLFYLKGVVESLFSSMKFQFSQEQNQLNILFQKRIIGKIQNVTTEKLKQFDLKQDVFYAEIIWDEVNQFYKNYKTKYTEIPKFPVVQRDLAFIIDKTVQYSDIQKAIKQVQSQLLQNIQIFDVFESDKIGVDKKSYAINLSFYNAEKTLTDYDVEQEMQKIILTLETKLKAIVRKN